MYTNYLTPYTYPQKYNKIHPGKRFFIEVFGVLIVAILIRALL